MMRCTILLQVHCATIFCSKVTLNKFYIIQFIKEIKTLKLDRDMKYDAKYKFIMHILN